MEQSDHQAHAVAANSVSPVHTTFSRDVARLPESTRTAQVELEHDEVFELRAIPIRKRIGDATVKMLAYNGSAPGPTLRVAQGSEVTIIFTNETDVESTVHWHGLRLDNRFDGVPEGAHHGMLPRPASAAGATCSRRSSAFWTTLCQRWRRGQPTPGSPGAPDGR